MEKENVTENQTEYNLYQIKPGYVLREISNEYLAIPVALDDNESHIAMLNEVGQFLWNQLQQAKSLEELTQAMAESYEVSTEEARSDIIEFINQLSKNNLLLMKMEERK